ncbi:hypothetical protein V1264_012516 [Littorina saxatilis]|uniref:Uncharacterized protein n=1 Tax=Littorina saxatilis TaxID=31220 RepID=A0AAN9GLK9_9CAEN
MASKGAVKGVSLLKRGWHEIPEIMCCLGMIGLSTVLLGAGIMRYDKDKSHRYKFHYTVVRPEGVKADYVVKKMYN